MSILTHEPGQPISAHRQLVDYFAQAAKPKAKWKIGCEHEKFPFRLATLKPVSYGETNGLRDLLIALQEFGWAPTMEDGHVIGLTRGKTAITFEPGGQVELGGAPLSNLHEIYTETDDHLAEICTAAEKLGIGFLGVGFHPSAARADIKLVPKERYGIQEIEMPKRGSMALDMMLRTCTVQVNLDFSDERDMVKKYRVSLALQQIATALFATSPFKEGELSGFNSYRMNVWTDVDPARCGAPDFVFDEGFGYERYVDYALDVPMQFVYRNGHHVNCYGQSFRAFMDAQLPALPGELPTINDWANHLTTLFPDVRLKKVLEMRGADAGDAKMLVALPAFWVGLLYDDVARDHAWEMVKGWTSADRAHLKTDVPRLGMKTTTLSGQSLVELSRDVLKLASEGLTRRAIKSGSGRDESQYLDILATLLDRKQNCADLLTLAMGHDKDFARKGVFRTCRLRPLGKIRETAA